MLNAGRRSSWRTTMPYVGADVSTHVLPAVGAHLLLHAARLAELESRRTSSLLRRQTRRLQRRGGLIEVVLDLIRDVAVGGRPIQERTKAARQRDATETCGYASAFRIRATAAARRAQSAVSASSCACRCA